jgi:hypothetical protein
MEGMVRAANRNFDLALVTSWHTARFGLNGYFDKGKLAGDNTLSDLLTTAPEPEDKQRLENAKLIHGFNSLVARGVPIEVTRH